MEPKKFAVVLAGCGVYDGAEIQEAVLTLLSIDKLGGIYQCFAPDINQYHVINHLNGNTMNEIRNARVEAARIARGNVLPLSDFSSTDFDAIVFPGGFGVAKNLCTFALDGANCSVNPDAEKAIKKAYAAKLPIGALCIAPALIARVLGKGTLTIGTDANTAKALESLGVRHQITEEADVVIDVENKIISSPCYMQDTTITVVAEGAENVIRGLFDLMKE